MPAEPIKTSLEVFIRHTGMASGLVHSHPSVHVRDLRLAHLRCVGTKAGSFIRRKRENYHNVRGAIHLQFHVPLSIHEKCGFGLKNLRVLVT